MLSENGNGNSRMTTVKTEANGLRQDSNQLIWTFFIRYCAAMGHGEIEKLKIQDGVPVMAEITTKKVRFGP